MNNSYTNIIFLTFLFLQVNSIEAQDLYLIATGENKDATEVIDSLGYQEKHPSFSSLQKETDTLLYKLNKSGYLDSEIKEIEKINDSTFLSTILVRNNYSHIKIFYPSQLEEDILRKISSNLNEEYFILPISEVEASLKYINNEIANAGKPFSYIHLSEIRKTNDSLEATLVISDSQKRTIDNIVIKGYEDFPKAFIKHFARIKKGQEFNKAGLNKKIVRLRNLRFANSIRNPEVLFTKDSTSIYLYLEKRNSNMFDGFLGFATDEESNNLEINGYVNLQLINNLNFGETLSIIYKNDGDEQQRFNAQVELPYLFNSPIGLTAELNLFRKDTTFTTNDQIAKLNYQLTHTTSSSAGYRSSTSNYLLEESEITAGQVTEDYNAEYFSMGGKLLVINDYNDIIPIKTNLSLNIDIGKRQRLSSSSNQILTSFRGSHIFQLNPRNSIFLQNESSYLKSDDYLQNELFRFGGITSLRGFEENSLLASLYSSFQSEYRYLLSSNLYAHTILDYAYTENNILKTRENLYGIGFGLALKTQAGLLKVNFANGKSNNQNFDFKNIKIHLSLIAFF